MVGLRDLLPGARKRRKPRPDAPKTIVPERARQETPEAKLDAARDRLRREIPPKPEGD